MRKRSVTNPGDPAGAAGAVSGGPADGEGSVPRAGGSAAGDGSESGPSGEGDVVYSPRGVWHGFNNTSDEDVVLVWGWMGAGSIEDSGYENPPGGHK